MTSLKAMREWKAGPLKFGAAAYLVEAATAGTALLQNGDLLVRTERKAPCTIGWNTQLDYNGRTIVMVRSGGFGDLLFLTPVLREMKHRWPRCALCVATTRECRGALEGNPHVDEIWDYPVLMGALEGLTVLWPEGLIEWDERATTEHVVDLHAEWLGLELTQGKELVYRTDPGVREAMEERFPWSGRRRFGVQMQANHPCRTYPPKLLAEVIALLLKRGFEVMVFGAPDENAAPGVPGVVVLPNADPPLSFAESCALLPSCDVFIGPDSSLVHVAGALGVPTVALYGPFPWQIRTAYARSVRALQGHAKCAPCFWHGRDSLWPKGMPCEARRACVAMESLEPERVVRAAFALLGR